VVVVFRVAPPLGPFPALLSGPVRPPPGRRGADYTDGVLTLRVPVKEQAKPRRVTINAGIGASRPIDATTKNDQEPEPAGASVG
jgi:hypothetical protein